MCEHKVKKFKIPAILNFVPRKMKVEWACASCGEKGTEMKFV